MSLSKLTVGLTLLAVWVRPSSGEMVRARLDPPTVSIITADDNHSYSLTVTNVLTEPGHPYPDLTYAGTWTDLTHPLDPATDVSITLELSDIGFDMDQVDDHTTEVVDRVTEDTYTIQCTTAEDGSVAATLMNEFGDVLATITASAGWETTWPSTTGINLPWVITAVAMIAPAPPCDPSYHNAFQDCIAGCFANGGHGVQSFSYKCTNGNVEINCVCRSGN